MMKLHGQYRVWVALAAILMTLGLSGCGGSRAPIAEPDTAEENALEEDAAATDVAAADVVQDEAPAADEDAVSEQSPAPRNAEAPAVAEAATAPPTATLVPTATPTPIVLGFQVSDGDDGNDFIRGSRNDNRGRGVLLPGIADFQSAPVTFDGRIAIRIEVFDTRAGLADGDGIEFVDFQIENLDGNQDNPVFEIRERFAPYCLFGDGGAACNVLRFAESGNRWPNGLEILNGNYLASMRIVSRFKSDPNDNDPDETVWRWAFRIAGAIPAPQQTANIEARFVEIGRGSVANSVSTSLVFQVEAFDSNVGSSDGDGIENINLRILDPSGTQVYGKIEETAAYCAFGGNAPCQEWHFADNGMRWPGGAEIRQGPHRLIAEVNPLNGDNVSFEQIVEIRFDGAGGDPGSIIAEFAQIGPGSTDSYVSNALVFQVRALDSQRGADDGDGIQNVTHEIFGPDGEKVYERTEGRAAYCAFSGGEPDCVILVFADTGNQWPETGKAVQNGPHRLVATVRTESGATRVIETEIQIQR